MKNYVTYTRKKISEDFYADPNTNNGVEIQTKGQITFHETPYHTNGIFIAWIEFDGRSVNPTELEFFRTLDPDFNFKIVTEEEIVDLLNREYNGFVIVKNFVFTDNRNYEE